MSINVAYFEQKEPVVQPRSNSRFGEQTSSEITSSLYFVLVDALVFQLVFKHLRFLQKPVLCRANRIT